MNWPKSEANCVPVFHFWALFLFSSFGLLLKVWQTQSKDCSLLTLLAAYVEVLSWRSLMDNKAIKGDVEVETRWWRQTEQRSAGVVLWDMMGLNLGKLYSDVTDWTEPLCFLTGQPLAESTVWGRESASGPVILMWVNLLLWLIISTLIGHHLIKVEAKNKIIVGIEVLNDRKINFKKQAWIPPFIYHPLSFSPLFLPNFQLYPLSYYVSEVKNGLKHSSK